MSVERFEVIGIDPLEVPDGVEPHVVERGVAHLVADPSSRANRRIVDLAKAAGEDGLVHFSADYRIARPAAGGVVDKLLAVVPNRGMVGSVPFSRGLRPGYGFLDDAVDAGDAFLLRRGWAVLWCGWQWDLVRGPGRVGLDAPLATEAGAPITGTTRVEFLAVQRTADHALSDAVPFFSFRPLPTVDVHDPHAVLTSRTSTFGPRTVVPRDRWRFAHEVDGVVRESADHVWLDGGFEPFHFYELVYRTDCSVVTGAGELAWRDVVGAVRDRLGARHVVGSGASQSGRFLRQMLHDGTLVDEAGRRVVAGLFVTIAGARLGEFNHRYAQPSLTQTPGVGHLPPFSPADVAGAGDEGGSALDRPRLMSINSSFEYWRGDAAYVHAASDGRALDEPGWARNYLLAGTDHMGPVPMKDLMPVQNPPNLVPQDALLRALFVALEAWVVDGVEPPPSAVPRLEDGTLVPARTVLAPARRVPGFSVPDDEHIPAVRDLDLGPDVRAGVPRWPFVAGARHETWVAAVDADGNEMAGIRHPLVAAPVATNVGWNTRRHVDGLPDVLYEFVGSQVAFARDEDERAATGDPRPSLASRHADRAAYERAARRAAEALVGPRFLLAEDVDATVAVAVAAYDARVSS